MQTVTKIINHLTEQAKKYMLKNGQLEPKIYFLLLYPGHKQPVYMPIKCSVFFNSEATKELLAGYVRHTWRGISGDNPGTELIAVCLVSDTWLSKRSIKGMKEAEYLNLAETVRPSNDPNRREAIVFTICFSDHAEIFTMFYKRNNKKIEYEEAQYADEHVFGRMASLYPN